MSDGRAFARGVGGALDLYGISTKEEPDFDYKGKNLAEESIGDEFSSAWQTMGCLMTAFIHDER
jgi:hypothetical protein